MRRWCIRLSAPIRCCEEGFSCLYTQVEFSSHPMSTQLGCGRPIPHSPLVDIQKCNHRRLWRMCKKAPACRMHNQGRLVSCTRCFFESAPPLRGRVVKLLSRCARLGYGNKVNPKMGSSPDICHHSGYSQHSRTRRNHHRR